MAPSARSRLALLAATLLSLPCVLAMRDAPEAKGVLAANQEAPESLGQLEMRSLPASDQASVRSINENYPHLSEAA